MMNEVNVCCVLVTYNGMRWMERCLQSLAGSQLPVYTLIVDNGSNDETVSFIRNHYPDLQIIETQKNLGYGKAANIGMSVALQKGAKHVLLLNQDAYIEPDMIGKLVTAQAAHPEFGILSPIQANGKGDDFDFNFYTYFVQSDIRNLLHSVVFESENDKRIINTKFINGAAWLVSCDCIQKTGGFDPAFFHYGEDDNYANRTLFHGFKIGILPTATVYHDRHMNSSQYHKSNALHFKRDSTIFLNQACDPNQPSYKPLLAKRFLRYGVSGIINAFTLNKEAMNYYFSMARFVTRSYKKIRESRHVALTQTTPYLALDDRKM